MFMRMRKHTIPTILNELISLVVISDCHPDEEVHVILTSSQDLLRTNHQLACLGGIPPHLTRTACGDPPSVGYPPAWRGPEESSDKTILTR